jgi:hypothetical protein
MDGRRTKGTTAVKSDEGRQTRRKRNGDEKKRYTNDDLVVLRVLGSDAAACWSLFRLSESTTTGIRSPRHGEIIKAVRIRETVEPTGLSLCRDGIRLSNVIAAPRTPWQMSRVDQRSFASFWPGPLGGRVHTANTRQGLVCFADAESGSSSKWFDGGRKVVLLWWYLRLS